MEDSFKEDSFVEEKVGGDSFVEDSFVADVPEKKNAISQSSSVDGSLKSTEEVSGYAPRSTSQIKQENVKRLDFGKSNVLKQQMAKDLIENQVPLL